MRSMARVGQWPSSGFRRRSGAGLPELIAALVGFAQNYFGGSEGGLIARERGSGSSFRIPPIRCVAAIAAVGKGDELVAEDLRAAAHSLGRLLGRVDVEDILDVIFREFCVGK